MEQSKVSVIVPVYNVEHYLKKCINSICQNTYKNLEIILVDDGSTDFSGKICDEFKDKDPRIKVIHKSNGGLSSARNAGMKEMTGQYILFVDSDDYLDSDIIELMIKEALKYDADIVQSGYERVNEEGKKLYRFIPQKRLCVGQKAIVKEFFEDKNLSVIACGKLFRKEIIDELSFLEGKNHEDNIFMTDLLERAERLISIDRDGYKYLSRNNSIVKMKFNEKKFDALYANHYMLKKCKSNWPEFIPYVRLLICKTCFYLYNDMRISHYENQDSYLNIIREFKKNYFKIKTIKININLKDKIRLKTFFYCPELSVKIYRYMSKG